MGGTRVFAPGLDLREALGACARIGYARVASALSSDVLGPLRAEIDGGPIWMTERPVSGS